MAKISRQSLIRSLGTKELNLLRLSINIATFTILSCPLHPLFTPFFLSVLLPPPFPSNLLLSPDPNLLEQDLLELLRKDYDLLHSLFTVP